jgi:1-phosphofructokinase family hexose kinase
MGLDQHWLTTAGSSRTCLILLGDAETGPTVINEEGPRVTPAEVEELRETLDRSVRSGDILCLSGSAPPGVPPGALGEIVTSLGHRGVRVMLDTSGARLAEALPAAPWGVAPNAAEASAVLGPHEPLRLAAALAERAEHVLLTLGSEGAIYAGKGESWRLTPPPLTAVNPIASGDALVAGFVWGMAHGRSGLESARLGVACGSANAAQLRAGVTSRARVEAMASEVREEPIPTSR